MEKLTIEQLASYLPYGLQAIDCRTKEIRTVTLLHFTYDNKTVGHNHLIYDGLLLSKHKPTLHDLSSFTKEITVDGYNNSEPFVPIEILWYLDFLHHDLREFEYVDLDIVFDNCYSNKFIELYKTLLLWHFAINIPSHLYINKLNLK